jgi:hypothetical protein
VAGGAARHVSEAVGARVTGLCRLVVQWRPEHPRLRLPGAVRRKPATFSTSCRTWPGAVRKRDGLVTFSSPPAALSSLAAIEVPARWLIGQGGVAFYKIDAGGTATAITGVSAPTVGGWALVQAPAITGQGPVYLANGVDTPQQWTGSGAWRTGRQRRGRCRTAGG